MSSFVLDNHFQASEPDDICLRKPKHVGLLDYKNKLLCIERSLQRSMPADFLSLLDMERACLCIKFLPLV